MPTYEYRCANGHDFEVFQKMSDDAVDRCPDCGAEAERLLSAGAGLLFKGPGFYITDSRAADQRKKAASKEPGEGKPAAEPSGDAGSSGKTEAGSGAEAGSGGSTSSEKTTKVD